MTRARKRGILGRIREYYKPAREPLLRDVTVSDSLVESCAKFLSHVKQNASFFKQSATALFISIVAGLFAGVFLGSSEKMLLALPGLIVLVPIAIGMRGNIFSSLGSRLGSALHLGTVSNFTLQNRTIKHNIYSSIFISIIFSVVLAFIARFILLAFGVESISLVSLVVISFLGGIISGLALLAMTFIIVFASYKRGWDPDNVTSPVITALGDMITIPALLLSAMLIISYSSYVALMASIIFIVFIASCAIVIRSGKSQFRKIIMQSSPILLLGIILDAFSGMILQANMNSLAMLPIILFLIPGFLEQGGNIGNILASRLSTKLHLGTIKPRFALDRDVKVEILNTYIFAFILFPVLGALTLVAGSLLGISGISWYLMLRTVLIAGIIVATVVMALAFFISVTSFKLKVDPDNTTLPLIASVVDVIGVVSLMAVLHWSGVF